MSELLPFQKNSTLSSRVLTWLQSEEPKVVPLPVVIMQECLSVYIKKQVSIPTHLQDFLFMVIMLFIYRKSCFYLL